MVGGSGLRMADLAYPSFIVLRLSCACVEANAVKFNAIKRACSICRDLFAASVSCCSV